MQPYVILFLGLIVLALLVFQVLTGTRVIRFQGRVHATVHRWTGYAILGIVLVHMTYAVGYLFFGWF
jgi:hypothetical protein